MIVKTAGATNMTAIVDITESELEKEIWQEEREEEEEEEEEEGSRDVTSRTPSTDLSLGRPSSSESRQTSSARSDRGRTEEGRSSSERQSGTCGEGGAVPSKKGATVWQSLKRVGGELNHDTRTMFRYIGRKLHRRHGPKETKVKEIHILPGEEDDRMWARRMAGSANSRSSSGSDPSNT